MSITTAIVFYIVLWAMVFYMVQPLWQVSQREAGEIVPGTPESAPVDGKLLKKALVTTAVSTILYGILYGIIEFQVVSLEDLSWIDPPSLRNP